MNSNYLSSLYQEWEILLDCLSVGLLPNFVNVQDEYNAVQRIYNTPGIREIFTKWLSNLNVANSNITLEKSKDLSNKWREKGNNYFKSGNIESSLKYYNLSILSAPRSELCFSLAVANRSAVLVKMGKFQEALSDIDLALQYNYPADKTPKLNERKQKCLASIQKSQEQEMIQKISSLNLNHEMLKFDDYKTPYDCLSTSLLTGKHPQLEGASTNIDLKYSDKCGRFITSTKDIKRGEVLFVENPYAFVALPGPNGVLPVVCENCCHTNKYPIACTDCAGSVYCSEQCRKEAWETFHQWECNGTCKLLWQTIGIAHLALRVLLIASKEKFGLKTELNSEWTAETILTKLDQYNKTSDHISGYHRVYNLLTNFDKMATKDLLQYTLTSVMLTMYLKHHSTYFSSVMKLLNCNEDVLELVTCCLLLRHFGQMVSSGHALCGIGESSDGEEIKQTRFATGIFPSASMMNHSCDSNITNNHHGKILVVRASRDIASGEEVFNCYGPSFKTTKGTERRLQLKSQYLFECQCTACTSTEKDNFVDIFNSFKCPQCASPIVAGAKDTLQCSKCNNTIQSKKLNKILNESLLLCQEALEYQGCHAIGKLLEVYKIQQNSLVNYNTNLQKTMDTLAKHYAVEGSYDHSISLIKQLVPLVKYQYGENSVEVGHELQKLCDVMQMKLDAEKNSTKYRDILTELRTINKNVLDIFYHSYGSWSSIYKDVIEREARLHQEISNLT